MVKIGQRLKEIRLKKKLTLEEISKATKIRVEFLSAIENGEYQKLPEKTYAHGFVGNYAEFLGLSKKEILPLFRREFDENTFFKVLPEGLTKSSDFSLSKTKIGRSTFLIIIIFFILLGYILFQYRSSIFNPVLEVSSPKEAEIIKSSNILVFGKTDPNNTIYINDISVPVNNTGQFSKKVDGFTGKMTLKVKSVNRFGKETIIERHIEVKP